jgi:hypothetical protein
MMKLPKFEKRDMKFFLVFIGVVAAVLLISRFLTPYLPAISVTFLFISLLILVAFTWGFAGHAVMKSLFLVGANLTLVIFLAQSYCDVPSAARTGNDALATLIGFAILYIGYEFINSVYKEIKSRMNQFKEANNNKSPWPVVVLFALFVGLFILQVWQVISPIIHNLCIYQGNY